MLSIRRALFSVMGGFAITDMYVDSAYFYDARLEPLRSEENLENGPIDRIIKFIVDPFLGSPPLPPLPLTSLRDDIDFTLQEHRFMGTLLIFMVISFGGIWSVIGSGAAIAFNGNDGAERYTDLKKWLCN